MVKLPYVSDEYEFLQVDIYVFAEDEYAATAYKYVSMNATNTYSEEKRPSILKDL
jgi:hypothetical protein